MNELPCEGATVFSADLKMSDLGALSKTQSSSVFPTMNYLSSASDAQFVEDLSELDTKISSMILSGEKVILLGRDFSANSPKLTQGSKMEQTERKILSTDEPSKWTEYPESSL